MNYRLLAAMAIVAVASSWPALGQAAKPAAKTPAEASKNVAAKTTPARKAALPRTPWGDPDLQGVWNDATSTPLERPGGAGKNVLNDEEAVEFQDQLANNLTRDRRDGGPEIDVNRAYNEHWMDARRLKITADRRTSLIVDPPDGRVPARVPLSPEREKARAARQGANARFNAGMPDSYEDFSLPVQCIIRTDSPPYLPTIYNNDFQIFQSPGYVVIGPEMIHSARIIPLDGRPHIGKNLHQWLGDSRGHWEADTLVVETTNFRTDAGVIFQGGDPETYKITERFTRVADDSLNYEFTIDDPHTWTKPWTALIPWTKIDPKEQMYEYACHEDNYDLVHFLSGARSREKNGEKAPESGPPVSGPVER
jgi:hypothetical protein